MDLSIKKLSNPHLSHRCLKASYGSELPWTRQKKHFHFSVLNLTSIHLIGWPPILLLWERENVISIHHLHTMHNVQTYYDLPTWVVSFSKVKILKHFWLLFSAPFPGLQDTKGGYTILLYKGITILAILCSVSFLIISRTWICIFTSVAHWEWCTLPQNISKCCWKKSWKHNMHFRARQNQQQSKAEK